MNKTCYKQYDTRWATLPYPRKPWYLRNCGCGEVSVCNSIIEMKEYSDYTPKTIQPYMVQFAESHGNGTYHYGIPTAMRHYGLSEVKEHSTMSQLWAELRKGNRVAILLMGSRAGGTKGVHWTGSGHFVCATGYKENGKHWLYIKDSASISTLRNGWISYEDNIRGACLKVWSGKMEKKYKELTVDGIGGKSTVDRLQQFLGVKQYGEITIKMSLHKYCPALKSVEYGDEPSQTVKAVQKWLGFENCDGFWGEKTSKSLQKKIGIENCDGIFGEISMKYLQRYLNEHEKAVYPSKGDIIAKKASELAYATNTSAADYPNGKPKKAFKEALDKAYPNRSSWGKQARAGASCDVFVGTVMRATGIDPKFPRGLKEQIPYVKKHYTQVSVTTKTAKDGDIIVYKHNGNGAHICIVADGKIKEASFNQYYPKTTNALAQRLSTKGKKWVRVYRAK